MLPSVRHVLVLEGDRHIVKETLAGSGDGFEGTADDADVIKEEEWVVLIRNIRGLGSSSTASIVHGMEAVEHL